MNSTFSVLFYLKKVKGGSGKQYPIIARITINGDSCIINTHLKCYPFQWNAKQHEVAGAAAEAFSINAALRTISVRLSQIYQEQRNLGDVPTSEFIKDVFTGMAYTKNHLLAYFEIHNENVRKQVGICKSGNTYQKYERTRKHLADFMKRVKCMDDIPLYRIDHQFICEFEIYLRTAAGCGHNTTAKFMQFFKRIIILSLNNGYIKKNPFQEYQIKLEPVNRNYLTMEELKTLMQAEFPNKRLEKVRDLFVFSSFCGLSYIDLKNLKSSHLYTSFDGALWIRINRQKSDETVNVKVFEVAHKLILKYQAPARNTLFPVPSNQKVNQYLKEIAGICGIEKRLTFHVARHTAATLALSHDMPMESVSKLLGHANIRTTQLYAKITDHKLSRDMVRLEKRLKDRFGDI